MVIRDGGVIAEATMQNWTNCALSAKTRAIIWCNWIARTRGTGLPNLKVGYKPRFPAID